MLEDYCSIDLKLGIDRCCCHRAPGLATLHSVEHSKSLPSNLLFLAFQVPIQPYGAIATVALVGEFFHCATSCSSGSVNWISSYWQE